MEGEVDTERICLDSTVQLHDVLLVGEISEHLLGIIVEYLQVVLSTSAHELLQNLVVDFY